MRSQRLPGRQTEPSPHPLDGSRVAAAELPPRLSPRREAVGSPLACRESVFSILNRMVQYSRARLDASFAAISDATRRGVLDQLGRSDASITDLAERFHMTLTGMKKH